MSLTGQRRIGAFKPAKSTGTGGLGETEAEAIAATAFAALAEDGPRLVRFMRDTGIEPDDLRAAAGSRDILCAVLEHVLGDESLLLVIATQTSNKPETLAHALAVLQKPALGSM
jgi:hypothetical protein